MIMQGQEEQKQVVMKDKTNIYNNTRFCVGNWPHIVATMKGTEVRGL